MTKKREKLDKPVELSIIMNNVLAILRKDVSITLTKVERVWKEALGDYIGQNTKPHAIKGKLLIVSVSNSALLQECTFLKQSFIEKINTKLSEQAIEDIKFVIGTFK